MKRALLAEDDPVSRSFLSEALALAGWQVEAFERGEDAAEAAIAHRFDVLILDLNLPGEDGIASLRRIRNRDEHASADAPALALTADDRPEQHRHLRRSGFDAVAVKPLSMARLEAALAAAGTGLDAGTPSVAAAVDPDSMPVWDDAPALAAVGGSLETLAALRSLLAGDLPGQLATVLAGPGSPQARDILHRLRAACGFCGAVRLAQAAAAMESSPSPPPEALVRFAQEVERVLATPWR